MNFITLRDNTGRATSLGIEPDSLRVIGILPHNTAIAPDSVEEADKWITWLQEWRAKQTRSGKPV